MYYILKQLSNGFFNKKKWVDVSLYDNQNHYRGFACFQTRSEAEEYMKIYQDRIQRRREHNKNNNNNNRIKLQIFMDDKLPATVNVSSYYFSKTKH